MMLAMPPEPIQSDILPVVNGEGLRPSSSRTTPDDDGASRTAGGIFAGLRSGLFFWDYLTR